MSGPRIMYAVPSGGRPKVGFVQSYSTIIATTSQHVEWSGFCEEQPVQMARSQLARLCLNGGFDYLLFHDDDLCVSAQGAVGNPLDALVDVMGRDPRLGVVGAVYLRRGPYTPVAAAYVPDQADTRATLMSGLPPAPFLVEHIGTGFLLIRRQVLVDLYNRFDGPLFRFAVRPDRWGRIEEIGEDVDFCHRAWDAGWKVAADPRIDTEHIKSDCRLPYNHAAWEAATHPGFGPGVPVALPCWALEGAEWVEQAKPLQCMDVTAARAHEAEVEREQKRGLPLIRLSEAA